MKERHESESTGIKVIQRFLCFHFYVFLLHSLELHFLYAARYGAVCATRLLLLLLFVSIQKLTFVHSLKPRVYAVEPNVLLNEMFTLFCDQSSNSASRQTLSLSHPLWLSLSLTIFTHSFNLLTKRKHTSLE